MRVPQLQEGVDYTRAPDGSWVFTRAYLVARGKCCYSGCRNCPYRPAAPEAAGPPKPPDCTCAYPDLVARNACGHPEDCGYYPRWKAAWDRAAAQED